MTYEELQEKILDWADGKDLLHEDNADKQFMKFIEEVFEFRDAWIELNMYLDCVKESMEFKDNLHNVSMEFGDIIVTLIILAKQMGMDVNNSLEMAYNKISKRKGKTINGTFVKEEDL